jgi:hypothetical protein
MLRTLFPTVLGAALLFTVPAFAGDDRDDNGASRPHADHAFFGERDYSRCFWHRPMSAFLDGEGGFESWRVPHRSCGWGREPDTGQYGEGRVILQHG